MTISKPLELPYISNGLETLGQISKTLELPYISNGLETLGQISKPLESQIYRLYTINT